jgi:hypothetical protein
MQEDLQVTPLSSARDLLDRKAVTSLSRTNESENDSEDDDIETVMEGQADKMVIKGMN